MAELLARIYRLQHRGQAIFVIEITNYFYLFSIVDSKILKVHSKIFSTSSLVKISRSRERFPPIILFAKWRCLYKSSEHIFTLFKENTAPASLCGKNGNTTEKQ